MRGECEGEACEGSARKKSLWEGNMRERDVGVLDQDVCYEALKSHDARFDGKFFVGVASTGIYCRPVCHARLPKRENCTFFETAAAAEAAGFRPCLLCRPERAPGLAPVDAERSLAHRAARLLREGCCDVRDLESFASRLGYTGRHLRRAFAQEYGVTPAQYLQTCRLLLAKQLLGETQLSVARVAQVAGFGSQRRFNQVFRERYGMTPSDVRRRRRANKGCSDGEGSDGERLSAGGSGSERSSADEVAGARARAGAGADAGASVSAQARASAGAITLKLAYRPPYAWDRVLGFLQMRAIPGVEVVRDGAYYRVARIEREGGSEAAPACATGGAWAARASRVACDDHAAGSACVTRAACSADAARLTREDCAADVEPAHVGWISVRPCEGKDVALVTVSESLLDVLPQVIARVRHQFDLDCDPHSISEGLRSFQEACPGTYVLGQRLPGCFDAFEMCVRAVLGQQVSVKGASTLAGRVARALGKPVDVGVEGLTCAFPSAADVAALGDDAQEALGSLGIIGARVRTIRALACGLASGELDLSYGADPQVTVPALVAMPGIGPWTAHYVAMRATGWTDAFPASDLGVKKALAPRGPREIEALAEGWRPWRAYATMSLWCAGHERAKAM